jgi:hypothetical protein
MISHAGGATIHNREMCRHFGGIDLQRPVSVNRASDCIKNLNGWRPLGRMLQGGTVG